MPRTKDPALEKQRREQVADAAIELLTERPWQKVTLSAVAQRAGFSKGVVTYWYADKNALMMAAIQRFHARYAERLLSVASEPLPIRERLDKLVHLALPDRETLRAEAAFQAELWSFAKTHPPAETAIAESYRDFRMAAEALLMMGKAEGYVTVDTDGLYFFVHALIDGVSLHLAYDTGPDVEETRARLLRLLDRWFRHTS